MNNSQFRSMLNGEAGKSHNDQSAHSSSRSSVLGSRHRTAIPTTPRNVTGRAHLNDFARKVADHQRSVDGEAPTKKVKVSSAPKGSKLPQGYEDRAFSRRRAETIDGPTDAQKRVHALEQILQDGQIDQITFDKLKQQIGSGAYTEGERGSKGLDFELLRQARQGEESATAESPPDTVTADFDGELDAVLSKEPVHSSRPPQEDATMRQQPEKPASVLSRDEILRRWKQNRSRQDESAAPDDPRLSEHFKKASNNTSSQKKRFIETIRGRRREVLLTTDKDGNSKRKVKWLDNEVSSAGHVDEITSPLGMEVSAQVAAAQKAHLENQQVEDEDDDDDIFQGVGSNYDPLADVDSGSESDEERPDEPRKAPKVHSEQEHSAPETSVAVRRQNYFAPNQEQISQDVQLPALSDDPNIFSILQRAAALRHESDVNAERTDRMETMTTDQKLLEKLRQRDQEDAQDLDMSFGDSRFGDEEDEDGANWNDGKKSGRKRGPKKKKGDKDNVNDVMSVLAGRPK